jgi:hypothetical protein
MYYYAYDTYMSWYNWYYGITPTNAGEEVVARVVEMDETGEVVADNIVNTTTEGQQIIPTINISEIKTISGEEAADTDGKTISDYVKNYVVETNYRLRANKKHNR